MSCYTVHLSVPVQALTIFSFERKIIWHGRDAAHNPPRQTQHMIIGPVRRTSLIILDVKKGENDNAIDVSSGANDESPVTKITEFGLKIVEVAEKITKILKDNLSSQFGNMTTMEVVSEVKSGKVVENTVKTAEEVIREVTNNDDYQFGDITKGTVMEVKRTTEDVLRTVTQNEDYRFGDITKSALTGVLDESLNRTIVDLPAQLQEALGVLTDQQKWKLKLQALQLLGIGALSINFVFNAFGGLNIVAAWIRVCVRTGASPLTSGVHWTEFMHSMNVNRILYGSVLMPVQLVAAYFLVFRYWLIVRWVQKLLFQKKDRKIINRFVSIFLVYFFGNVVSVASVTGMAILLTSKITGVPI